MYSVHRSAFIVHRSYFNCPSALVGAREACGEGDCGDHARMFRDATARDVEGRAVIDRSAYEREAQRHVDGLAEREALDGNHRLIMVARNDRVELAARRAKEDRVRRERP